MRDLLLVIWKTITNIFSFEATIASSHDSRTDVWRTPRFSLEFSKIFPLLEVAPHHYTPFQNQMIYHRYDEESVFSYTLGTFHGLPIHTICCSLAFAIVQHYDLLSQCFFSYDTEQRQSLPRYKNVVIVALCSFSRCLDSIFLVTKTLNNL